MSRSTREPIIKDRPRNHKKSTAYWRPIRKAIKAVLKNGDIEDLNIYDLKNVAKETINDYDYSDYTLRPTNWWLRDSFTEQWIKETKRK